MRYDPDKHHRRSIRLRGYDYTAQGAYFVTICVQGRMCELGDMVDNEMQLNDKGRAVAETWLWLGEQYSYVTLDSWVIMPNHMHGIIAIDVGDVKIADASAAQKQKPLGRLVGAFKTVSTKRINQLRDNAGDTFWQRDFWDHVIRSETELTYIRDYIESNPAKWMDDQLYPEALPNPFNQS